MTGVHHVYDGAVDVHSRLTLKHRDPSQHRSRRSSTSSASESIFDDDSSVSSQASAATSYSAPPTDHIDSSDLESISEHDSREWLLVEENRQLQAELLDLNVVHIDELHRSTSRSEDASYLNTVTNTHSSSAVLETLVEFDGTKKQLYPERDPYVSEWIGHPLPLRVRDALSHSSAYTPSHSRIETECACPSLSSSDTAISVSRLALSKAHQESQNVEKINDGTALPKCHPRRSAPNPSRQPPSLVRQEDRRKVYVEQLVDVTEQLIAFIWPNSRKVVNVGASTGSSAICLRYFVREVLKRSRASHSTLQVALYYCFLIWKSGNLRAMDGRRMFLSSLILAYKYLQDRNYSTHAWHSISSLPVNEIKKIEVMFLQAVDYKLFICDGDWLAWRGLMDATTFDASHGVACDWQLLLQKMARHQAMPQQPPSGDYTALISTRAPSPQFEQSSELTSTRPVRLSPRTLNVDEQSGFISPVSLPDYTAESSLIAHGIEQNSENSPIRSMPSAPRETPLSSPESTAGETSYHPTKPLGREVHMRDSKAAEMLACDIGSQKESGKKATATYPPAVRECSVVEMSCDELEDDVRLKTAIRHPSKQPPSYTLDGRFGAIQPETVDLQCPMSKNHTNFKEVEGKCRNDYDVAVMLSLTESPPADSPSSATWVETNIDPYEAYTDEADRLADALYAKNHATANVRRKRSIGKAFTAGADNSSRNARTKMSRYRR